MNYSIDEFNAVAEEVEKQGGALLNEKCVAKDIIYTAPPYVKASTNFLVTCGCSNVSRFAIEYNGDDSKTHLVTACAICDGLGAWPRYIHAYLDAGGEL
jgi:hypothetical protein